MTQDAMNLLVVPWECIDVLRMHPEKSISKIIERVERILTSAQMENLGGEVRLRRRVGGGETWSEELTIPCRLHI